VEELDRRPAGTLQVVHGDQDRAASGEAAQEPADRGEALRPLDGGCRCRQDRGGVGERGELGHEPAQGPVACGSRAEALGRQAVGGRRQRVDQRLREHRPLTLEGAPGQHRAPRPARDPGQLREQAALADAGFAGQEHESAAVPAGVLPLGSQQAELGFAPGEPQPVGIRRHAPGVVDRHLAA
jgi:hypothetical protein